MFLKLLPHSRIMSKRPYSQVLFSNIWAGKTLTSSAYHTPNFPHLVLSLLLQLGCFKRPYLDLGFFPIFLLNKILKPSYLSAHILPNKFTHPFKIRKMK